MNLVKGEASGKEIVVQIVCILALKVSITLCGIATASLYRVSHDKCDESGHDWVTRLCTLFQIRDWTFHINYGCDF